MASPVLVLAGLTLYSWAATGTFVVLRHREHLIDEGEMIAERHGEISKVRQLRARRSAADEPKNAEERQKTASTCHLVYTSFRMEKNLSALIQR